MKASFVAFAFLVSIGSAQAGEIASPANAAKIGETAISRMYRVAWLANFGRQRAALEAAPAATHAEIRTAASAQDVARDGTAAASAAVTARMKAIAVQVDEEMRVRAAGKPLSYRAHIDCSSKTVAAARSPHGPQPAILAAFGSDVESVQFAVETCRVKVYWKFLDRERHDPRMRAYSVSLPIEQAAN